MFGGYSYFNWFPFRLNSQETNWGIYYKTFLKLSYKKVSKKILTINDNKHTYSNSGFSFYGLKFQTVVGMARKKNCHNLNALSSLLVVSIDGTTTCSNNVFMIFCVAIPKIVGMAGKKCHNKNTLAYYYWASVALQQTEKMVLWFSVLRFKTIVGMSGKKCHNWNTLAYYHWASVALQHTESMFFVLQF